MQRKNDGTTGAERGGAGVDAGRRCGLRAVRLVASLDRVRGIEHREIDEGQRIGRARGRTRGSRGVQRKIVNVTHDIRRRRQRKEYRQD